MQGVVKNAVIAGNSIIVSKGYRTQMQAGQKRAPRENITREAVMRVNERYAVRRLTVILNANFKIGDFHIVWTYRPEERVAAEIAREYLRKAIKNLRKAYRKAGKELKYVHVTEYKNGALHHHLVINAFDLGEISACWKHGTTRVTALYSTDLSKLAEYLIKETKKLLPRMVPQASSVTHPVATSRTPNQTLKLSAAGVGRKNPSRLRAMKQFPKALKTA